MVRIFFDRIWDRIRLEGVRSICIWVRMFNIRYRIRITILKLYIYNVDIQSYLIRYGWHYPYSYPNPTRNMKINMISVISVRIWSVFISTKKGRGDQGTSKERRKAQGVTNLHWSIILVGSNSWFGSVEEQEYFRCENSFAASYSRDFISEDITSFLTIQIAQHQIIKMSSENSASSFDLEA